MNPFLKKCPVCSTDLTVTRLHCPACDTTIEGVFNAGENPLAALSPEQVQFVLTFVRCEGRFNRMEQEMRLSYPTLRSRLNDIIRTLGYEPDREEAPVVRLTAEDRRRILEELDQGTINWEEAQRRLKGLREEAEAGS